MVFLAYYSKDLNVAMDNSQLPEELQSKFVLRSSEFVTDNA